MTIPAGSIPFNRSAVLGRELHYVREAIESGEIGGGQGFSTRCESLLQQQLGVAGVTLTGSCTQALEMAALLLRLTRDDEVIVPAFSFVSTANAFALRGAKIVFCDVRPDTLNLDERALPALITPSTKAIVPVHYAGVGCEMDTILETAARAGVAVIEDNAHGIFGRYRGLPLGTFGELATLSFHETKNLSCGEGGALVINRERFVREAERIRDKGTNRAPYLRGEVPEYTWVSLGSSFGMSDLLAAFLYGQLEQWAAVLQRRGELWNRYHAALAQWSSLYGITQPSVPSECEPSWHLYYLLLPSQSDRTRVIEHLKARGILAVFHYQPLHLSPMGVGFGGAIGMCPVTERVCPRLLRLPLYNTMTDEEHARVIDALLEFRC